MRAADRLRRGWMAGGLLAGLSAPVAAAPPPDPLSHIDTIVVVYLENHSFDNLYGRFPGADGIDQASTESRLQLDRAGKPYAVLPRVLDTRQKPAVIDPRFPERLPNGPFEISRFVPARERIADPLHRFFQHQRQINGGRMNRFVAESNTGGLTMGYYDGRQLPLWEYARRYTLMDHFFAATFGGSFLNHMWLACACTPRHPHPPASSTIELDADGQVIKDGAFTADGYAVNNVFSAFGPRNPKADDPARVLPPQTQPTLGDRLSERQIDWAWYAGGWSDAVAGQADGSFQFHHQPYTYFSRYADGTPARKAHLKDEADFMEAIRRGRLPAVSFFKPLGVYNEHPGDAVLMAGEARTARLLAALEKSPQWPQMLVIVTYDEYGGFWDHVAPPRVDRWGPGSRVPALLISPFSRGGRIEHGTYDTTSILKLIETRFGLAPLSDRDAKARNLADVLRF